MSLRRQHSFVSETESLAYHFMVVEMVLHSLYYLIVLVSLAGNQYYVTWFSHHTCCANGFAAVYYADDLLLLLLVQTRQHVVDDVLWLFEAWIVARNDYPVAVLCRFLCHDWTLALVTVASGSTHRPPSSLVL